MRKVLENAFGAGSRRTEHDPVLIGDVLRDMLLSNSPLAVAYRERMAAKVSAEEGGVV